MRTSTAKTRRKSSAQVERAELTAHPGRGLRASKTPRRLPGALSAPECERLIESCDTTRPLGRRNRALLEFIYSAGSRAAETAALDLADLDLQRGIARVRGKGRKDRLVAVGAKAREALTTHLADPLRPAPRDGRAIFLNARGGRLTTTQIYTHVSIERLREVYERSHPHA
ncbi:MAG: tyrosine-type recombinase/integrase [Planctomycetes bacterium]|nr:tyrosine-type recombinase/integrase [Planctomycetota bacterium]